MGRSEFDLLSRLHPRAIRRVVRRWNLKNLVFELTDLRRKVRRLHNAVGRPVLIAWLVTQRVMSFPLPLTLSNAIASPPPRQGSVTARSARCYFDISPLERSTECARVRYLCEWQCMCTSYLPPLIATHAAPVFISLDTFLVNTLAY